MLVKYAQENQVDVFETKEKNHIENILYLFFFMIKVLKSYIQLVDQALYVVDDQCRI